MKKKNQNKFLTFELELGELFPKIRECTVVKYSKSPFCYSMTAPIIMQPLRASGIFCSEANEIFSQYIELDVPLTESIHLNCFFYFQFTVCFAPFKPLSSLTLEYAILVDIKTFIIKFWKWLHFVRMIIYNVCPVFFKIRLEYEGSEWTCYWSAGAYNKQSSPCRQKTRKWFCQIPTTKTISDNSIFESPLWSEKETHHISHWWRPTLSGNQKMPIVWMWEYITSDNVLYAILSGSYVSSKIRITLKSSNM
jgi:hypothetical protein